MKDGGLGEGRPFLPSHLEKPVLNGLSDLLRLPQYPVLGVRASAHLGAAWKWTIRSFLAVDKFDCQCSQILHT